MHSTLQSFFGRDRREPDADLEASFPPSERKESKEMTGQQLRFYLVDVFAQEPLCGNPLALVVNATALITLEKDLTL